MSSTSQQQLTAVYQLIKTAQDLESNENELEAYKQYLTAVQYLSSYLLQSTPHNGQFTPAGIQQTKQLYKMCNLCLERAESLFKTSVDNGRPLKSQPRPSPLIPSASLPEMSPKSSNHNRPIKTVSAAQIENKQFPKRYHSQSIPVEPTTVKRSQYNIQPLHVISPMDAAKKKNYYLMEQYKASLRNNPTASLRTSQNLSLEFLRRREENLSIARTTERTMSKKLREREHRLQESTHKLKSMDSLTMEELKAQVTSFELHKVDSNLNAIKQRLINTPTSTTDIVDLIHKVLNTIDHPLCRLLGECQYSVVQLLQPMIKEIEKVELPKLTITTAAPSPCTATTRSPSRISPSQSPSQVSHSPPTQSQGRSPSQTLRSSSQQRISSSPTQGLRFQHFDINNTTDPSDNKLAALKAELLGDDTFDDEELTTLPSFVPSDENWQDMTSIELKEEEMKQEVAEEEEMIKFHSIVPVSCTIALGNTSIIELLSKKYRPYLEGAVKLVHSALDKLVESFVYVYVEVSEDNVDICRTTLESSFFPPIISLLSSLYRCINYKDECLVANNMYRYVNATPRDVTVRKKFWLHDRDTPPYSQAIDKLKSLVLLQSPSAKLDCLVSLSKCIVQTIEDYYKEFDSDKDTAVGVDDILPIMTYIILKSGLPQLVSECVMIQEFIQNDYMMGEEGFCLTTFDTALQYVKVMNS